MIKLASPDIREEDIRRVISVLRSGDLVQGVNVKELEELVKVFLEMPFCVAASSGTAALHLALLALGVGKGDAVIVPAFTFPATANVVEIVGAEVVLCDVHESSYVVEPESIKKTIEENKLKNIKAIIIVHEFGYPVETKQISEIAQKHGMFLIEDAACAFGTISNGHPLGYYSDLACYSFHPRKAITSGEGGAVVSLNEDLIKKITCLRNHGIEYRNGTTDFIYAGLNYRMTDFQAALAIGQLNRFNDELTRRKKLASYLHNLLIDAKELTLPKYHENHSWQSFMITLPSKVNRSLVIDKLLAAGIQTNLGAQAINCLSYYSGKYGYCPESHPTASKLFKHGLVLPFYGKLSLSIINAIAENVKKVLKYSNA